MIHTLYRYTYSYAAYICCQLRAEPKLKLCTTPHIRSSLCVVIRALRMRRNTDWLQLQFLAPLLRAPSLVTGTPSWSSPELGGQASRVPPTAVGFERS